MYVEVPYDMQQPYHTHFEFHFACTFSNSVIYHFYIFRTQGSTFHRLSSVEPALTQEPSWEEYAPNEALYLPMLLLYSRHLVRCSRCAYSVGKSVGVYHGNNRDV